jgi:hypothetical protein
MGKYVDFKITKTYDKKKNIYIFICIETYATITKKFLYLFFFFSYVSDL